MKTLYFEGSGMENCEQSKETIGNCRIRTAFHLWDGSRVYLEITCGTFPYGCDRTKINTVKRPFVYEGFIDSCHYITDEHPNDDCNLFQIGKYWEKTIPYTEEGILEFVNRLGASFDAIKVVNQLGGYRVHREHPSKGNFHWFGDEFWYNPAVEQQRKEIHTDIYQQEKADGKRFPNFSLCVDENDPMKLHLLRHFNGYNRRWVINNIYDYPNSMEEIQ